MDPEIWTVQVSVCVEFTTSVLKSEGLNYIWGGGPDGAALNRECFYTQVLELFGEREKQASHSQVCSIENRYIQIYLKMIKRGMSILMDFCSSIRNIPINPT